MDEQNTASTNDRYGRTVALLFSVFAIGTCGLIYELLAGTIASYMLGDSVTQFSTIIGVYLFSMGLGSYLSRYFRRDLIAVFIQIEILVGLIGGLSSFVLFLAFAQVDSFRVVLYSWVTVIGILVGLEIPFVLRILKDQFPFSDLISKVLSLDYLGGLVASLLFPLWLVPQVGLMRSSFVFGVLNLLVAIWTCHLFREQHRRPMLTVQAYAVLVLLLAGVAFSEVLLDFSEQGLYRDPVIFARSSVLAPLAVDQAAARCSYDHESVGNPPAAVSTTATNTRRVTSRPVKMSLRANRLLTRRACMAGVLVSRPNRKARCGRTKL